VVAVARVLTVHGLSFARASFVPLIRSVRDAGARALTLRLAAVELRRTIADLGVAAIKVGQILSTRPDVLPPVFVEELAKLQDAATPIPAVVVEGVIEDELGRPWNEVFATFEPVPLAAASIGQAHAATLSDGHEVVVKVRRRGAAAQVELDLGILERSVAAVSRWSKRARRADLTGLVADFAATLRAELDYGLEADNAERFASVFATRPDVHIPGVHRPESTRRVITIDRIRGMKLDDVDALDAAGIDRRALAARAAEVVLTMVFQYHFFHADPHPGNFFVEADGRLGIIDFGMVGTVDAATSGALFALLAAVVGNDADALGAAVTELGVGGPSIDQAALLRDLDALITTHLDLPLGELAIGPLLDDVFGVFRHHHLHFPNRLALLVKTLAMCEGVAVRLDPTFRMTAVLVPYVQRMATAQETREDPT
jgi:ubiquinone biosynthesis protein